MKISINDVSFTVDPFEHNAFWESISDGDWELNTYKVIDHFVEASDTLLDVGAWAGPISLYAAFKANKVYALEPDPLIFPQLKHNIALNDIDQRQVVCLPLALDIVDGKKTLYARKKYGQSSSSLLFRSRDSKSDVMCQTVRLETLIREENISSIDFIKLDIEGGEFLLLPKLQDALQKLSYPTLMVSFHYNHLNESFYKNRHFPSFLSRILLKMEQIFHFNLFAKQINECITACFHALEGYSFVYSSEGELFTHDELKEKPSLIQSKDFIFTNKKWPEYG